MSQPFIYIDGLGGYQWSPLPPQPNLSADNIDPPVNDPDFNNMDLLSDDQDPAFSQLVDQFSKLAYQIDLDFFEVAQSMAKVGIQKIDSIKIPSLANLATSLLSMREVTIGQLLQVQNKITSLTVMDLPQILDASKPLIDTLIKELERYAREEANKIKQIQPIMQTISKLSKAYTTVQTILATVEKIKPLLNKISKAGLIWANPGIIGEIVQETLAEVQAEVLRRILIIVNKLKVQILNTKIKIPEAIARVIL